MKTTIEDVRKLYHREPFEPFVFALQDGRRVEVAKRIWMAISEDPDAAWVFLSSGTLVRVVLDEVTSIEKRRSRQSSKSRSRRKAG